MILSINHLDDLVGWVVERDGQKLPERPLTLFHSAQKSAQRGPQETLVELRKASIGVLS